jgi:uncharacterized protein (DUF58 family)
MKAWRALAAWPPLAGPMDRWLYRLRPAEAYPVRLRQRRIFVLPTRAGLAFGVTLFAMLLASINYTLSLGFALTFLLAGVGIASVFHAFRNLLHLELEGGAIQRAHVGQTLRFEIIVTDRSGRARPAITVRAGEAESRVDVPAGGRVCAELPQRARRRGWQPVGRVVVETTYPLGLIRAWSVLTPDQQALVYPALEPAGPPPPEHTGAHTTAGQGHGEDDFSGLREHRSGDSPRRIAWKAVARSDTLVSKEFTGGLGGEQMLDWDALPASLDTEARLSRLARWVVEAGHAGQRYALHLPGRRFPAAASAQHLDDCLEALALHGAQDTA